jgi:hypothetical protein
MISEVRNFLHDRIREVDKDLTYDGLVFEGDRISANNIDSAYKLVLGSSDIARLDVVNEVQMSVDVIIYKASGTKRLEDFDNLYCKAIEISAQLSDQTTILQSDFIKSVQVDNINPEQVPDDENSSSMRISLIVTCFFQWLNNNN